MVEQLFKETLIFAANYRLLLLTLGFMIAVGVCWDILAIHNRRRKTRKVRQVRFIRGFAWLLFSGLAILLSASTFLYIPAEEASAYSEDVSFSDWDNFRDSIKISMYVSQDCPTQLRDTVFHDRAQRMLERSNTRFDSALALIGLQHYHEAISKLDREIKKVQSEPSRSRYAQKLFYFRAIAGGYSNHNEAALSSYDSALVRDSTYSEAWFSRALVLRKLSRFDDANRSFDNAIRNADGKKMLVMLGMAYIEYGAPDKALACFNNALSLDRHYAEAFSGRAIVRHRIGNTLGSLSDLDSSLFMDSTIARTWSQKGIVLAALDSLESVLASLDRATSFIGRDSCEVIVMNADALINVDEAEKAKAVLDTAIVSYPYSANAFYQRSRALLMMGKFADARADADQAGYLSPHFSDAFLLEGVCSFKLGDTVGALKNFDSAFALDSQTGPTLAWLNRGRAFLECEHVDTDSALISFSKAFAMGESIPELGFRIAKGLIAVNEPSLALISVRRALTVDSSWSEASKLEAGLVHRLEARGGG